MKACAPSLLDSTGEALTMDEVDDKLLLVAFHNGVNSDLFIHKLYEKEPQPMAELVHSAQNFMNAEDAIIAKKRKRAERMEANPARHSEQGPRPKKGRTEDKKDRDNRKTGPPNKKSELYTLKCPIRSSTHADQGRSFLEVAREDERRS